VSGGIAQLPWRAVTNPFRLVENLSADQVETIHLASLRILRKIGFEILGDSALELFAGAGAEVDRDAARSGSTMFGSRSSWPRRPPSSASNVVDAQAAYESERVVWGADGRGSTCSTRAPPGSRAASRRHSRS
jgi:trimethylamine:corrinoid methyltransferase-like protein